MAENLRRVEEPGTSSMTPMVSTRGDAMGVILFSGLRGERAPPPAPGQMGGKLPLMMCLVGRGLANESWWLLMSMVVLDPRLSIESRLPSSDDEPPSVELEVDEKDETEGVAVPLPSITTIATVALASAIGGRSEDVVIVR